MSAEPVQIEVREGGAYWRVALASGKGNVLDATLTDALTDVFVRAGNDRTVKAVSLEGHGAHFSFGASVQEHLPGQVDQMLHRFHRLVFALLDSSVVVLAAVRGQCLGGGLEIVSLCHRVFAAHDARLGQPEIALGVFPPVASLVLAERVGRAVAEDICLTGRIFPADEALRVGLVDELADDPSQAAFHYAHERLFPHSASSLRLTVRALRHGLRARLGASLPAIERLYLEDLMATADAAEGLRAFIEKRRPTWQNN